MGADDTGDGVKVRPLIDMTESEVDDVADDQFGRPVSDLYRPYDPPFAQEHQEALLAFRRLSKRYGKSHRGA